MAEHHAFIALPEDLFLAATETARRRGKNLSDLLIELLSDEVEDHQWRIWVAERMLPTTEQEVCLPSKRPPRSDGNPLQQAGGYRKPRAA